MTKPTGRPRGRPSKLDLPIARRGGGVVTVSDALIDRLAAGALREEAARSIGLAKQTLYNWLHRGALARQAIAAGRQLTPDERRYAQFVDAVEEAEANALLGDWATLGQLAAGGMPQVTTTVKVVREITDDNVVVEREVERTTRTSHTLPDANVLIWRLEHRWPHLFGRNAELPTGDMGENVDDLQTRARALVDEVVAYKAGLDDARAAQEQGDKGHVRSNGDGERSGAGE